MLSYLAIAAGGALGAAARVGVSAVFPPDPDGLPWATLAVNVFGALCLGAMSRRTELAEPVLLFVSVGFLGSFTTFSTFAFEMAERPAHVAVPYALITLGLGTAAAWFGSHLDSVSRTVQDESEKNT